MSDERLQKIHDCDKAGCGLYCKTTRQRRFGEPQLLAKLDLAIKDVAERAAERVASDTADSDASG